MNKDRAHTLAADLKDGLVDKWTVCDLINFGKSAAVFAATCDGQEAALKIFDVELVERYGKLTQLNRIAREVSLAAHKHPNLVEIYGGGECPRTGFLYVVMERIDAPSLDFALDDIPRNCIRRIMRNVAQAAQFLETLKIAHRDIKPANIAVTADKAVLLDLGVIRAIANPSDTDDHDAKQFVGTLQYSPPEFLLRTEEDSIDGWRAVTFYQLGAVLHDLITKKSIFSYALDPYARLVNAVQQDSPVFTATDVPLDLISLAERCLVKDPTARLDLVSWTDFESDPSQSSPGESAKEKIRQRLGVRTAAPPQPDAQYERLRVLRTTAEEIRDIIRGVCVSEALLPPLRVQELRIRDAAAHFTITFSPSKRFGLDVYFAFDCMIILVDAKSQAVIVNASAWLDVKPPNPIDSEDAQERIFAGFVQTDSVGNAILNFVLPAYERALTLQASAGHEQRRVGITPILEEREI